MPLSKEFYLDEIKSKYPNSYNESLKDLPIKDLEDMLDFLESALEKADGGSIGIEVLFGPKREDFSIGGRAKPTQTYDPRASAVDYATALEKVGGGTAAQKRQDLSNYLGNLISTQGQKLGNAGVMALQGAKGVLGIQGTPITDSMKTSLQNIIQKQIQDTGKLSGNINYLDYGVLTDRKGQEFLGFGDRSFTDPEAALATTLGKASYAVDPRTGKVTFTGGTAYDFGDDQFGGLGKFISKGGVFSDKATQYNPDIGLSSDFIKQYNPSNISQSGVLPGFTKLRNPNSSPGNYNEFMYKGPDGQIYGSQTYASMAASGSYKDIYKDYYSKQKLADGGRVGLFMGGPALEGKALDIYNSMNAYGFTDQEIADALSARGLYTPAGSGSGTETTQPNIIGAQLNQDGGGGGITELQETFRTEPGDPKNFRLSQLEGTADYFPPTTMMGKAKNFIQENLFKPQVKGTLGTRLANQPKLPIPSFASFLSNYTSPFNMKSNRYNPLLEEQLNFAETQEGIIGRDPNSGLLKYGPESVLAGKNVISMFGTNDYEKMLQDYIAKMNANKRISATTKAAKLAQAQKELEELQKKTEAARAAQYGAIDYGRGSDGQRSYSGDAIGAGNLGFGVGATTGGPVSNRTGRGRQDYSKGGLATMFKKKR